MSGNTQNVKLGVCKVIYKGVNLGLTKGGVEVDVTTQTHPVTVDQYGESIINEFIMKRDIKVTLPLAETTIQNLAATMPGTVISSNGSQATGTLTFSAQPVDGDTVTINGVVFTFKAALTTSATSTWVLIGSTLAATVQNLVSILQTSIQDILTVATYDNHTTTVSVVNGVFTSVSTATPLVVNITYGAYAAAGNSFTLAKTFATGTSLTLSGAALSGGTDSTKMRADVTNAIGTNLLALAGPLTLHPIANSDANTSEDLIIPLAATAGSMKFAYKYNEERIFNTEFTGYPTPGGILFQLGDLIAPF